MNDRAMRTCWSDSCRATAVVAEAFSTYRTALVSAFPGPHRDRFAKDCVAAAIGKRILVFAPDEATAEPIRSRLAFEIANRMALAEQDRQSVARANAERKRAEAERELAALRATTHVKPGFIARLFGAKSSATKLIEDRISAWEAIKATAEAEIRRLDGSANSTTNKENSTVLSNGNDQILDSSVQFSDVSMETPVPLPYEVKTHASMTSAFASPAFDPSTISIATPADLPYSGPAADLAIMLAAERITAGDFATVAALAPTQILIGDPTMAAISDDQPEYSPEPPQAFFARQWSDARPSAWTMEGNRIVCRLECVPAAERSSLNVEAVIDQPEIELRFTTGDDPVLVEIAFAPEGTAAQARAWLAAELQESRPSTRGQVDWIAGDTIRAVWYDTDASAGEWIESVPGVRELVVGTAADAVTAELRFDPAAGWTRESAEEWLNERRSLSVPPTVELPSSLARERQLEFATAG